MTSEAADWRTPKSLPELREALDLREDELREAWGRIHRLEGDIKTLLEEMARKDKRVEELGRYADDLKEELVVAAVDLTRYQRREIGMMETKETKGSGNY